MIRPVGDHCIRIPNTKYTGILNGPNRPDGATLNTSEIQNPLDSPKNVRISDCSIILLAQR